MDPIRLLSVTTVPEDQANVGCDVVQVVRPSSMLPISTDVTSTIITPAVASSLAASTTTTSAAAASGYYCATTQGPTRMPQANQTPGTTTTTSDMPSMPSTDNNTTTGNSTDNHYQLRSPEMPLHSNTACYAPDTVNPPIDTYQLLQQPLPYFTIHNNIPNPSPGRIYPPTDSQQILTAPNGPTVLPRYTGVTAIDQILGEEYNERIRRQYSERHMGYGHRQINHRDSDLYDFGGVQAGRSPVVRTEGVGMIRRWACTGVLLLVGALPWLIAMATFIRQRNTALTGLLGLVFVFFMAVILGRLIRRAREAHWLARQERRRRQHCIHHVCSTPMLMAESPPAYEVVVKSPPPYSISCDSSSRQFPISITVPQQLHDSSTPAPPQFQYSPDCGRVDSAPSFENLDIRRTSGDGRDPNLPSYDEAVGRT